MILDRSSALQYYGIGIASNGPRRGRTDRAVALEDRVARGLTPEYRHANVQHVGSMTTVAPSRYHAYMKECEWRRNYILR